MLHIITHLITIIYLKKLIKIIQENNSDRLRFYYVCVNKSDNSTYIFHCVHISLIDIKIKIKKIIFLTKLIQVQSIEVLKWIYKKYRYNVSVNISNIILDFNYHSSYNKSVK